MNSFRMRFFLGMLFFLFGCSTMEIHTDWDTSVDFSRLKTYNWTDQTQAKTGDLRLDNPIIDRRIRDAVDANLAAKGFQKKTLGASDFWVDYHTSIQGKLDVSTIQEPYYSTPIIGARGQMINWSVWGGGTQTFVSQYDEGTLVLDIANPTARTLMWRGCLTDVVEPAKNPEDSKKQINRAIQKLLKDFPPKPKS